LYPQLAVHGVVPVGNDAVPGYLHGPAHAAAESVFQICAALCGGNGHLGHAEAAESGVAQSVYHAQVFLGHVAAADDDLLHVGAEELVVHIREYGAGQLQSGYGVGPLRLQRHFHALAEHLLTLRRLLGHALLQG